MSIDGWVRFPLGQVITLKRGYDLPKRLRKPGSVPIISSSGPSGTHSDAKAKGPGVVTGRYGTLGEVFWVPTDYWPLNTSLYVKEFKKVDRRFAFYLLKSLDLTRYDDKSGVPGLNRNDLHDIEILLPPTDDQHQIAHILGSLDDKIELNRKTNETLEAIARALFQSWFVDFDPVVAKAAGRKPFGVSDEVASLFPDSFEDSKLGPIPKGWELVPIGDVVTCVGGGTPSTKEPAYWDSGIHPFATPKGMSRLKEPVLLDTERYLTDAGVAKISSRQLPAGTVLLSSRAPIGYLAIAGVPVSVNQGIIAMVCDGAVSNHFALRWTAANMDSVYANANGTTFLEISKKNFRPIVVVIPPPRIMAAFDSISAPLHEHLVSNVKQSKTLAELRELLLPKLLSGEIRVKAAEKLVANS